MNLVFRLIDKEGYLGNGNINEFLYEEHFINDVVILDIIDVDGEGYIGDDCIIATTEFKFFEEISSLVEQCVHTHKGKWKFNYCDRYMHWDKKKGWNLTHGKAVYYTDFERAAVRLGYVKTKEECYTKNTEELATEEFPLWDGKGYPSVGMKLTVSNSFDAPMVLINIIVCSNGNDTQYLLAEETTNVHHLFFKEDLRTLVKDPREAFCEKMLKEVQGSHPDFAQDTTWDVEELAGWCWDELKGGDGAGN